MRRRQRSLLFLGLGTLAVACNAGVNGTGAGGLGGESSGKGPGSTTVTSTATGTTPDSSAASLATGTTGTGGTGGIPINPCGTACGPSEICDGVHKGIDDNCDGTVDEGCPCNPGEAESCFKGDPSYLSNPGCFPGTQHCSENGTWGPCEGGSQPDDSPPCFETDQQGCHPISSVPFATTALADGCGTFDDDADPGSSDWSVMCPPGVTPCPVPDAMGNVQFISSGEYNVSYTKNVAGSPMMCTYPVYVGAPGLRVELSWESGDNDVDLHMHEPGTTTAFPDNFGGPNDCGYGNCKIESGGGFPEWFPMGPQPPNQPVSWYLDPVVNKNTCYFAPRGAGAEWQATGMGCHNPRLDIDNTGCDPSVLDSTSFDFCAPENINVDFPPADKWTRIAVHYYSAHANNNTIHPNVKIFCNGALSAELGATGFGNPQAPIAWNESQDDVMWYVADVRFIDDQCNSTTCEVKPIYQNGDRTAKAPLYAPTYGGSFGPAYPP